MHATHLLPAPSALLPRLQPAALSLGPGLGARLAPRSAPLRRSVRLRRATPCAWRWGRRRAGREESPGRASAASLGSAGGWWGQGRAGLDGSGAAPCARSRARARARAWAVRPGLAGKVLEDALVGVVVAVVVVGQDPGGVGAFHVPAQRLAGALKGRGCWGAVAARTPCPREAAPRVPCPPAGPRAGWGQGVLSGAAPRSQQPPHVAHRAVLGARPCPARLQHLAVPGPAPRAAGARTWSLSSSRPSVAMLPDGFFRGGLERRRARFTLSRITWVWETARHGCSPAYVRA